MNDTTDSNPSAAEPSLVPVVGIGASAGGLKSIEAFFDKVPNDTGMAFVIVQHLSPDHKSLMAEIMARRTRMPIKVAGEGMQLLPNQVYLNQPGKLLRCAGSTLSVSDSDSDSDSDSLGGLHRPIDVFFKSMAENIGIPVTGIVLSGTGSDGTAGLVAIHNAGGITIAEAAETAEFDGMPRNAIATGCVDFILPPADMPDVLGRHRVPNQIDWQHEADGDSELTGVRLIFSLLGARYGLNFEHYKPNTIARRIERRQLLARQPNVFVYAEKLSQDDEALDDLFHDLLIGVTKFFRDEKAFSTLEKELRQELREFPSAETYRVWVAGCASGEEAYSLAMILLDIMHDLGRLPQIKVFATDIHQRILDRAALGIFEPEAMEFVSLERQERYFDQLDNGKFRVNPALRKHLVFACHNLIQDPPFTKMNLVSCRNVLIYFQSEAQFASLATLHFSLVPNGLLMLGASESLASLSDEFVALNQSWRIYRKIRDRHDLVPRSARHHRLNLSRSPAANLLNQDRPNAFTVRSLLDTYDAIVRSKVSMGLLLDENQNLIHVFGTGFEFLRGNEGRFSGALGDFLAPSIRTTITAALIRSQREVGSTFVVEQVRPDQESDTWYDISITGLTNNAGQHLGWFLQFTSTEEVTKKSVRVSGDSSDTYELLESELSFTKESLNASIEELETSNEELQATNEEMIASNEELQSTNEELQSVNEELHSVNAEYQRKIDELEELTNDLENLLSTSEIGTIFLDTKLRIRKFTKQATRHFGLMGHDAGRPLTDFTNRLGFPDLERCLREVVVSGSLFSTKAIDDFGESILIKLFPYRTGNAVSGVVLNVLNQDKTDEDLESLDFRDFGIWEWTNTAEESMWWSPNCLRVLGYEPDSIDAQYSKFLALVHPDDVKKIRLTDPEKCILAGGGTILVRLKCANGDYAVFEIRGLTATIENQKIQAINGSISLRSRSSRARGLAAERKRHQEQAARDLQDFIYAVSHDLQGPLRQIKQSIGLIQETQEEISPAHRKAWEQVQVRSDRLNSRFQCLLEYSRVNTRGAELVPLYANDVLAEVLSEFADELRQLDAIVVCEQLPRVRADREQLAIVFRNLIANAIQYRSQEQLQLTISGRTDEHRVQITVSDNGIGIKPIYLRDVFIIFKRLGDKPEVPGLGFGLAFSKRIVERHGGRIWAESVYSRGTTIHVLFPAIVEVEAEADIELSESQLEH